jgi:TrmH family RNA methyltransferase
LEIHVRFRRYKNELDYSYALGMAPTVELINNRPDLVIAVCVRPDYRADSDADIYKMCEVGGLRCETNMKVFNIAANKENIYVVGVFEKPVAALSDSLPHAVFVNPGDAGNLGTNIRTCLGFGINDVAVVKPGADIWSPRAVRASMGAVFRVRLALFESFGAYEAAFSRHDKYFFTPGGDACLDSVTGFGEARVSLVFGNEATGLPDEILYAGRGIRIPHADSIDSLNLSVAVGIAANAYYRHKELRAARLS